MSRSIKEPFPSSAVLIRVQDEDLRGFILEHLHSLSPNQLRQASAHNVANDISSSYESCNERIYEAVFRTCKWLVKHDFLEEISEKGFFKFSRKGSAIKTFDEFQKHITKVRSNSMPDDVHLRRLIKINQATGGSQRKSVNLADVFKDEGLSQAELDNEATYMEAEGWIKAMSDEGIDYYITHAGIKLAQTANAPVSQAKMHMAASIDSRNVFVVHGRNLDARNSLFRFLRSIGLRPLEWSQAVTATGKASPFIGEILDSAFSNAQAVVVLFTPDDEAHLRDQFRGANEPAYETELTGQARPNVLFEAGMAMGRNPDRTIIVELGTLRPFSDIAGRHTVRLSNESVARQELAQRLDTAGCPIDLSGRDWHTEGDFEAGNLQNP
jgi:predicted nucleotide-binding protein